MSGGGMGFIFDPAIKSEASSALGDIMLQTKQEMECFVPFAMNPVVFNYTVNEKGTVAELCSCSNQSIDTKQLLNEPTTDGTDEQSSSNEALDNLLREQGFDTKLQDHIRTELKNGTIGLSNNRLPLDTQLSDVTENDVVILDSNSISQSVYSRGIDALSSGSVGVITLAAGVGSRWTQGAGVVKALNPYCSIGGKHRNFIDVHLAKNHKVSAGVGVSIPHVFTTSWMTHEPINAYVKSLDKNDSDLIYVSKGTSVGLRMIPMVRDLQFLFEEKRQRLDEQAQKVQDSLHAALIGWADSNGQGSDYSLNVAKQCLCT
jgi:hypothetical protein